MPHTDPSYDQIISKLRSLQPAPENPESLTQQIMIRIENLPQKKDQKLKIIRLGANIAAMLIISLFVYEMIKPPQELRSTTPPLPAAQAYGTLLPGNSIREKINQYVEIQKNQRQKRQQREELISNLQMSNLKYQTQ